MPFLLFHGDITQLQTDAIVNAANRNLKRGGGVCGAIFKAAGEKAMQQACDSLAPIQTGQAVTTPAFNLPSKYVIHAAGPVWEGGMKDEEALLASSYRSALELACSKGLRSIAFPLLSAGVYGYPKKQAYRIAVSSILSFLENHDLMVYLVLFEEVFFQDNWLRKLNLRQQQPNVFPYAASFQQECISESCFRAAEPLADVTAELDESFSQTLMRIIRERNLNEVTVYKAANLDRKHFSKIRSNEGYQPSKRTAISLALSLKLDREETNNLLKRAGYCLSHSYLFDIIIEHFIISHQYDIHMINEALYSHGQPLLGS